MYTVRVYYINARNRYGSLQLPAYTWEWHPPFPDEGGSFIGHFDSRKEMNNFEAKSYFKMCVSSSMNITICGPFPGAAFMHLS